MGRRMIMALLPLAALIVGTASPAQAASEQPRTVTRAFMIQGPQHFDRHGRLTTDLRDKATVERLVARAARRGEGVRPMAERAAERLARDAEYGTSSAAVAEYDDITVEECRERAEDSGDADGWIKNHFSYCQLGAMVAVQQRCWLFICRTKGTFSARVTLLGHAYNGLRNVDWKVTIDQIAAFGSANGARLTFKIDCDGEPNDDSCLPGSDEVTRSVQGWRRDGEADLLFFSPAEPSSPSQGEQIDKGVFRAGGVFRFPDGMTHVSGGPETSARFDSAWYLPRQQGSIFDRVTPFITYSKSDPAVNESAHHIEDAQDHPESTYPRVEGKRIPGASAGDPLHRLFHDTTRRRQNREGFAVPVCDQQWPGYAEFSQDCDEYPFASTYEGAARHLYQEVPYGWFSVRPVLFSDNQLAGSRLGTWYGADRILDGDAFYVEIVE
jgi:Deoxyribonuclease NucA/NucB